MLLLDENGIMGIAVLKQRAGTGDGAQAGVDVGCVVALRLCGSPGL
jgi:hypothetical protein